MIAPFPHAPEAPRVRLFVVIFQHQIPNGRPGHPSGGQGNRGWSSARPGEAGQPF